MFKFMPDIQHIRNAFAIKFQKTPLNQQAIKLIYQILKFIFSVPIICLILVVHSQVLRPFSFTNTFDNDVALLAFNYSFQLMLIGFFLFLLNTIVLIGFHFSNTEIIIKILICYILFAEAISNGVNAFIFRLIFTKFQEFYGLSFILILIGLQNFLFTYLVQKIFISESFQSANEFSHKYSYCCSNVTFAQKIALGLFLFLQNYQIKSFQIQQIAILLFLIVTQSFKLRVNLNFFYYYASNELNMTNIFSITISLVILTIVTLYEIFIIDLVHQNFIVLIISVSIFALISAYNYVTFRLNELYFKEVQDILQKNLEILYLITLFQLQKNLQIQYYALIVASIKKQHEIQCKNVHCYCHKDQTKEKNLNVREKYESFLKGYCMDILEKIQQNQYENHQVLLKCCYFRFEKFKSYALSISKLNNFNLKKSPQSSIKLQYHILIYKINQYIKQKNSGTINSQLPLLFEAQLQIIQKLIVQDIKLKQKKWKYLAKGLCKTNQIQQNIDNEIEILQKMQQIRASSQEKFMKNAAYNFLMIFYFGEIVFLRDQVKEFVQNLKEVLIPVRFNEVLNNKELLKNIFHQRCALIQSNIQNSVNFKDFVLNIQNCNTNVTNVFGYEKLSLINKSSEIIYPSFLWKEHKKMFFNFIYKERSNQNKKESNQQFKQASQEYFLNNLHQVFSGLRSVKMIVKADSKISLIILIFKKQEQNIVLLNEKQQIQEVGNVFKDNFGHVFNGLPIQIFIANKTQMSKMSCRVLLGLNQEETSIKTLSLIDVNKLYQQWNEITEEWVQFNKKYTSKFYAENLKEQQNLQNQKRTLIKKIKNQIKRKYFQSQKYIGTLSELSGNTQNGNEEQTKKLLPKLNVKFLIKRQKLLDFIYFSLNITQIQNKYDFGNQTQRQKSMRNFQTAKDMTLIHQKNVKRVQKKTVIQQLNDSETTQKQCIQNSNFKRQEQTYEKQSLTKNKKIKPKIIDTSSSINSSNTSRDTGYFYHKFLEFCRILFANPQNIKDQRLNIFTFCSIFFGLCLIALSFISNFFLSTGLYQNQGIFFADGAVSDNMQLAQYVYNRGMNLLQLQNNIFELPSLNLSVNYQRNNLYDLMTLDLNDYLTASTKLTQTKFYQYIRTPLKWYETYESTNFIYIQTNQFLQYFVYLSIRIQTNVLNPTNNSRFQIMDSLKMMNKNFPELQRINHFNLFFYQDMSNSSMSFIENLSFLLLGSHLLITFILLLWLIRQFNFRIEQKFSCYSIYKTIPIALSSHVSQFYTNKYQNIRKEIDLKTVQKQFERTSIYLPEDLNSISNTKKAVFLENKRYLTWKIFFTILMFIILNFLFGMLMLNYKNLFDPIKKMMISVNSIMDSENYMIQAFCDLKAKYLIENASSIPVSFFDDLLISQRQNQVLFNKISIESLELFMAYDEKYKSDFINLLINNTCELAKDLVSSQLYEKCKTYPKYNLLDDGVIIAMNFFQRKIRETLQKLRIQHKLIQNVSSDQRKQMIALFNGADYREIDEYNIFMFRMYQTTQARIYTSLDQVILTAQKTSYIYLVFYTCFILFGLFMFLLLNFKRQKSMLSKLYISFLLIPSPLIRLIKGFTRQMQRCLQYKGR